MDIEKVSQLITKIENARKKQHGLDIEFIQKYIPLYLEHTLQYSNTTKIKVVDLHTKDIPHKTQLQFFDTNKESRCGKNLYTLLDYQIYENFNQTFYDQRQAEFRKGSQLYINLNLDYVMTTNMIKDILESIADVESKFTYNITHETIDNTSCDTINIEYKYY